MCDSYCCRNRGYDGTCLATCRDITTIARALGARRCSYTRCPGRWKSRKSDHLGVGRLDHPLCFSVWSDSDAWITQMDGINHPSCLRNFGRAAGRFLSGHAHLRPVSSHSSNEIAATAPAMPAMQKKQKWKPSWIRSMRESRSCRHKHKRCYSAPTSEQPEPNVIHGASRVFVNGSWTERRRLIPLFR